jgi:predicted DNA-binding protein (MmcQ/YjbR family)
MIGKKMFCITGFGVPLRVSIKASDNDFEELINRPGIIPAPYLARYKWVSIQSPDALTKKEWEHYVKISYELVKARIPKKLLKEIRND